MFRVALSFLIARLFTVEDEISIMGPARDVYKHAIQLSHLHHLSLWIFFTRKLFQQKGKISQRCWSWTTFSHCSNISFHFLCFPLIAPVRDILSFFIITASLENQQAIKCRLQVHGGIFPRWWFSGSAGKSWWNCIINKILSLVIILAYSSIKNQARAKKSRSDDWAWALGLNIKVSWTATE